MVPILTFAALAAFMFDGIVRRRFKEVGLHLDAARLALLVPGAACGAIAAALKLSGHAAWSLVFQDLAMIPIATFFATLFLEFPRTSGLWHTVGAMIVKYLPYSLSLVAGRIAASAVSTPLAAAIAFLATAVFVGLLAFWSMRRLRPVQPL